MVRIGFNREKIDLYFKGKPCEKDETYINEVFCDATIEKDFKGYLSKQFDELLPEDDVDQKNLEHILYRINYDINNRISRRKTIIFDNIIRWSLRIASIIALPLIIFLAVEMYKEASLNKETWVEINAPAWTRAQFSLPDGTIGWLNSNSSIKYKGNFNADRQVTLTGEAFFDVFKDKNKPFIVNTKEVFVKVLGTRFNISSYENENKVEVVLEEGSLIFNNKKMNKSYIMNPNDLVIYDKTDENYSTEIVQPQKYLSWTEGKLVFRNDSLTVISRKLERWYNIDIEINVSLKEDISLYATFTDENLEEVLNLLKQSLPIDYIIDNGRLNPDNTYTKKKVTIIRRTK